jgi:hypothetical protein
MTVDSMFRMQLRKNSHASNSRMITDRWNCDPKTRSTSGCATIVNPTDAGTPIRIIQPKDAWISSCA